MKILTSFVCLVVLTTQVSAQDVRMLAVGTPQEHRQPDLSAFELAAPTDNPSPPPRAFVGKDTYTYLRCHYRSDSRPNSTQVKYEWATNARGQWYRVNGYWYSGSLLEWRNMFYTTTEQAELRQACADSLKRKGIRTELVDISGADTASSFNHTLWTQAKPGGSQRTERIIVFGDSLSDTHNLNNLTRGLAPNAGSWFLGRFSNGPVWPEYLGKDVGLTVYNWAVAGAAADQKLVIPGFTQQVDSWISMMRSAKNYDPGQSLFYLLIGVNDLINYDRTPDQSLASMEEGLRKLLGAGARKIVISNLPDAARTPAFRIRRDGAAMAARIDEFNARLPQLVDKLEAEYPNTMALFDANTFFKRILDAPEQAGFSDTEQSCLRIDNDSSLNYARNHDRRADCTADGFVFWDTLHPTTRMHQKIGQAMQEATPAAWLQ
ncbi:SGNH/GDSL hydrolase family protein [Dyella sp. GSA-30]|uniref:SGNH/GDSL hydrolase family protein n=1 Tax=Dyella sp. GSA-30 TaxID=2994496 RepID=UPI00248F4D59|nr:SGNH/GDSL hydrolase family protein [Dyella sp. GSA-30]BDU19661.1 thermolabile hemolysin [Dyella sp. GSA-30]